MKLSFREPFIDFDDKPVAGPGQPENMGKLLSVLLASAPAGGNPAMKFYDWAKALHQSGEIDVDRADQDTLRRFIENHSGLSVSASRQMVDVLNAAKPD